MTDISKMPVALARVLLRAGFAAGDYACTCHGCGQAFSGQKRSRLCVDCASNAIEVALATGGHGLAECRRRAAQDELDRLGVGQL